MTNRRDALKTLCFGGVVLASATASARDPKPPAAPVIPTALAGGHTVLPLPFAPTALTGISEKMIVSHHDKNYAGAVTNLNRVEQELAKITAETPPFVTVALREKELTFRNSKALHEAYFANLGGNGKRSGGIEQAVAKAYGSAARFEEHFRQTGIGLGGGSGWVVLAYELDTGALRTVAMANHTQSVVSSLPLFVMDMYEHAYQMDFGAAAAKYIDAFFASANWDEANRRLERAFKARAALQS